MARSTLAALAALSLVAAPAGGARHRTVVLGSKHFLTWGHGGWGEAHPDYLDFAGDARLVISHIRWRHWGSRRAVGVGRAYAMRFIDGAYYSKLVRAELRAGQIGRCSARGPRAYMSLRTRIRTKPGGPMGPWFEWGGGRRGLCHHPA